MLHITSLLLALSAGPIHKQDPVAIRKTIESAWKQFDWQSNEHDMRMAYYTMIRHPIETITFLREKIKPLALDQETALRLLKDLGSEDEKVWRPAFEHLTVYDMRLAMDLAKALDTSPSTLASQRLAATLLERDPQEYVLDGFHCAIENESRFKIGVQHARGGNYTFTNRFVKGMEKSSWSRMHFATYLLEQIGTTEAITILRTMASGHAEAEPVIAAKAAFERQSTLKTSKSMTLEDRYAQIGEKSDRYKQFQDFYELSLRPKETIKLLRSNLKPLTLTTERTSKLLKDLGHEKEEVYRPAFLELCDFDIRLASDDLAEWLPKNASNLAMGRLAGTQLAIPDIERYTLGVFQLRSANKQLYLESKQGMKIDSVCISTDPTDTIFTSNWYRIEVAIDLLEIFETPESIALLKTMATGHPRASPTIAAKEALVRLKVQ